MEENLKIALILELHININHTVLLSSVHFVLMASARSLLFLGPFSAYGTPVFLVEVLEDSFSLGLYSTTTTPSYVLSPPRWLWPYVPVSVSEGGGSSTSS